MAPNRYENYSNDAKIAILYFETSQKFSRVWAFLSQTPVCDTRELHKFARHVAQLLTHFSGKLNLFYL